ncbi:helix-turn-helix transcriptional regulator [uncultured Hydrogenophaga sp.]|uniref:response regulator transcription factor n=1 Tax=uncultured Hydrogenophaga sp. TaxID=199683 RepID=UPI00338DF439
MQVARQEVATAKLSRHTMATLSGRERQVITHVLEGMTMPEVARQLGVSPTTAVTYRYRAFRHLGIRTHRELLGLLSR